MAGEAVVKRDLDCSKFSEIARYLLQQLTSRDNGLSSKDKGCYSQRHSLTALRL